MTVVMADGCFDPVHDGHVAYLEAARALGDRLIVNMASDREIWEKRPKIGPLLPEAARRRLLAALKPVDEVVRHDTSDALRLLRPDIYAKGADWADRFKGEERDICEALGIRVVFCDTSFNSSGGLLETLLRRTRD